MPDHLPAIVQNSSAPAAQARTERSQIRRAGVSLQVRIRTADFNDGNFDEVRLTQNASRKAIYFLTEINRYYKGMRVRVTSPCNSEAGAVNLEQIGEVARVHKRHDGYGVAVVLLIGAQPSEIRSVAPAPTVTSANHQVSGIASTGPSERRCAARSPFLAPVEMVEMRTGSRIQARTSDLSPQGCYVDTLNPLPVGSAVRLQIHRCGLILDVLANVTSRHAGSGMGLEFGEITPAQKTVLDGWLGELGLPPHAVFDNPFPLPSPKPSHGSDYAVRLVQVLLRKGMLTQFEARQILDNSND
jgi:PilZ domain